MYTQYFGMTGAPFSIAPNPQFLYMSPRHQEALAHLLYGVQSDGGFILLTGEVGTGKTTLCRCLLEQIPQDVETAFVLNPRVTAKQLLASVCDEFGVSYPQTASLKKLVDNLNAYLLERHAEGKRAVLIVDEAQNLSRDLLEQLRLLTNLETSERKLLQIILLGQPELLDMLAKKDLRQFSQRITARFHLEALGKVETLAYIRHRLQVVDASEELFTRPAMNRVYQLSGGIPRVINLICDRALLGAYAQDRQRVTPAIADHAATEVLGAPSRRARLGRWSAVAAAGIVVVLTGGWIASQRTGATDVNDQVSTDHKLIQPVAPSQPPPSVLGHVRADQAYHDLFALWGTAFEDRDQPPCELAASVGLQCFNVSTGLDQLEKINRPAIVTVDGQYLTISRIHDGKVILIAGTSQYELTRAEFIALYDGEARLLWRTPPADATLFASGESGETVEWLLSQLAVTEAESPADGSHVPTLHGQG